MDFKRGDRLSSGNFCGNCGASLTPGSAFCAECGAPAVQPSAAPGTTYAPPSAAPGAPYAPPGYQEDLSQKGINPLLAIGIVILPLIGLITYFMYKKERPKSAEQSCYAAIIGLVLNLLLNFMIM